ncbi:chaperone modulator CbpM [Gillisia limnaea]|uniref:MerR family transcriptional regulator n=1 Tax=Gillisia limnaea (strain DSM 15749 / LMG 21470 / R-8282) TaxID=865937 RepID=H2BSH9_GILLR|nr:chaperone modulator CbpM [Gillisia limnaea]EHQ02526.1 hypothetical protein Gilli_1884 [Gillisia limnaea DSM 15749]
MNLDDLIATEELCIRFNVEHSFIRQLFESGLIEIVTIKHQEYVHFDMVAEFEKMHRLHYELDINLEGLEAIKHLLEQVKKLQTENLQLRNRLNLYE